MRNWLFSWGSLFLVRGQTRLPSAGRMPRAAAPSLVVSCSACAAFGVRALARLAARQKEALEITSRPTTTSRARHGPSLGTRGQPVAPRAERASHVTAPAPPSAYFPHVRAARGAAPQSAM